MYYTRLTKAHVYIEMWFDNLPLSRQTSLKHFKTVSTFNLTDFEPLPHPLRCTEIF